MLLASCKVVWQQSLVQDENGGFFTLVTRFLALNAITKMVDIIFWLI